MTKDDKYKITEKDNMKIVKVLNAWEVKKSGSYIEIDDKDDYVSAVEIFYNRNTRDWSIVDLPNLIVTDFFDRSRKNKCKYINLKSIK